MPNWCECRLEIVGDKSDLEEFYNCNKGFDHEGKETPLLFSAMLPTPKEVMDTKVTLETKVDGKNCTIPGWYDWRLNAWGTKWDPDVCEDNCCLDFEHGDLCYDFLTAWSPPIQWLQYVAKKFPTLSFTLKYDEPGCAFRGVATAEEGVVNDQCINY